MRPISTRLPFADPAALKAADFIGALMGKVIRDSSGKDGNRKHHTLGGLRLALPLFRHLAGEDVGPERLSELDPAQASSLGAMVATPGGADDLGGASHALETYSADGQMRVYDLLPNGADVAVTEANNEGGVCALARALVAHHRRAASAHGAAGWLRHHGAA